MSLGRISGATQFIIIWSPDTRRRIAWWASRPGWTPPGTPRTSSSLSPAEFGIRIKIDRKWIRSSRKNEPDLDPTPREISSWSDLSEKTQIRIKENGCCWLGSAYHTDWPIPNKDIILSIIQRRTQCIIETASLFENEGPYSNDQL